jgi:hypothetical protein
VYEGKDIQKWNAPKANKKLIVFQAGSTEKEFKSVSEAGLKTALKKKYPELFSYLGKFEKEAIARVDKGHYWWELRNCAYYDLFEVPKIIFPNLQNANKFAFDTSGAFLNAPAVFLPTDDLSLLAILNSKLIWFYLIRNCVLRSGGYIEVKPQYFERMPIKEGTKKEKQSLTVLSEKMLALHQSISEQSQKFIDLLRSNFVFEPTPKLRKWYTLEFIDVITELEKGGAKLPPKKQGEWLELFKAEKAKIKHTQAEIDKTDKEIDRMVYALYELTPEEIEIVEKG